MYCACETHLKKHGLLPGTSCTAVVQGDNPLEEGITIVFIARRQHQTGRISNLIMSHPVDSAGVEKQDL